jgi:hypothetical protein
LFTTWCKVIVFVWGMTYWCRLCLPPRRLELWVARSNPARVQGGKEREREREWKKEKETEREMKKERKTICVYVYWPSIFSWNATCVFTKASVEMSSAHLSGHGGMLKCDSDSVWPDKLEKRLRPKCSPAHFFVRINTLL